MQGKEIEQSGGGQSGVLDRLPFNLTQLLAYAMKKPRHPIEALDNAIAQLRAMPQFASKAYYSIPFKRRDGPDEIVEGPSIKAATALTGCWGNNVEGGFMGEETDDYVDVSGYYFDYETGKLTIRPWRISKTYRTRDGAVVKWRYDMLLKQIQAGVSKAIRNADLNGLPAGYVAEYYAEAKRIAARGGKLPVGKESPELDMKAIVAQIDNALKTFDGMGVSRQDVTEYLNRHPELNDEEKVAAHLVGLLNALEEGQTTLDEVFTVPERPIPEPQRTSAPPRDEPTKPTVAKTFPRRQASFGGASCPVCKNKISKGEWIHRTDRGWTHEGTCQ